MNRDDCIVTVTDVCVYPSRCFGLDECAKSHFSFKSDEFLEKLRYLEMLTIKNGFNIALVFQKLRKHKGQEVVSVQRPLAIFSITDSIH